MDKSSDMNDEELDKLEEVMATYFSLSPSLVRVSSFQTDFLEDTYWKDTVTVHVSPIVSSLLSDISGWPRLVATFNFLIRTNLIAADVDGAK